MWIYLNIPIILAVKEEPLPANIKEGMVVDTNNHHHLADNSLQDMGEFSEDEDESPVCK